MTTKDLTRAAIEARTRDVNIEMAVYPPRIRAFEEPNERLRFAKRWLGDAPESALCLATLEKEKRQ